MATYVVGDIQGCLPPLKLLLKKVKFNPKRDKLWAVGDLIGRGDYALETLAYLYKLGDAFNCVLGNHDLHFLAISQGIKTAKPADKFGPLLNSKHCERYSQWLRQKPLAVKLNKHTLLSHAGLYPGWSIKQAIKRSLEVEAVLQGPKWQQLLASMYGSNPQSWSKTLEGKKRLIFIINAFTRMRYIQSGCELNFNAKGSPENAPNHLMPWFEVHNEKLKSKQIVLFGHWASLQGKTSSRQHIALDTGYIWGNSLTMLKLESMQHYSVQFKDQKLSADIVA